MFTLTTAAHGRIYLISGRLGLFDAQLQGQQCVHNVLTQGRGAFLLGVHPGSFEVVRVPGRTVSDLCVTVAMYEESARNINVAVAAINPTTASEVIPPGHVGAMLQVREALGDNRLADMLVGHTLLCDAGLSVRHMDLLDSPAVFPLGPLHMAAILGRPVLLVMGLHLGGNRYAAHFGLLADFTDVRREDHTVAVQAALGRYVERVEHCCRTAPYSWFDYFDFWQDADAAGAPDHAPADYQTTQTL